MQVMSWHVIIRGPQGSVWLSSCLATLGVEFTPGLPLALLQKPKLRLYFRMSAGSIFLFCCLLILIASEGRNCLRINRMMSHLADWKVSKAELHLFRQTFPA